jgi:pimeloyl-ACP methyl ester carboxylesterase
MTLPGGMGEKREVALSAGTVIYRECGAGEPIVFIHGVVMNGEGWGSVLPALAREHRCIAPDWPTGGHRTPLSPASRATPVSLAGLVAEFLEALDLDRVTLVGLGLGTLLCQMVATHAPHRLTRLVFANGDIVASFPPRWARARFAVAYAPPVATRIARLLARPRVRRHAYRRFSHRIDDRLAESFTRGLRTDPAIRHDTLELMRGICRGRTATSHEQLREFNGPALIVWGEDSGLRPAGRRHPRDDRAFPPGHPGELARLLPQARVEHIPGARTFLAQDQPDAFADAVLRFMRESKPSDAHSG